VTVQQQGRRPRAAVAHPQHGVADVDPAKPGALLPGGPINRFV